MNWLLNYNSSYRDGKEGLTTLCSPTPTHIFFHISMNYLWI